MDWSLADYLMAATLLALLVGGVVFLFSKRWCLAYRMGCALSIATAVILFWVSGAVGIIGASENDANLAYSALLALGFLASFAVRLKPGGMALNFAALAAGQFLIGLFALIMGLGREGVSWPYDILAATIVFSLLWLGSAIAFRLAMKPAAETV
ncbi:hypothetical protein [Maricaulis parjimensis]|uniref:hypothetical protein n=1 Tax=Maricaulis parjimensis TaxID=144023 RepID=UPI00193A197E|nr:hypothetical protein [Maricaulis parjimensis]